MNTRNTVILSVIGIATMIITVVGASFAYFSTNTDADAKLPVSATTAALAASFMSTTTDSIAITVDAHEMQQSGSNDNTTIEGLTDNAILTVMLSAAEQDKVSTCTYDIIYTWSANSSDYIKTKDVIKEFTIEGSVTNLVGVEDLDDSNPLKESYIINSPVLNETNFDAFNWKTKKVLVAGENGVEEEKEVKYTTLVEGAKISSIDRYSSTNLDWTFTVRFYNTTKNQDDLRDKNFTGSISVNPDTIEC